MKYRGVEYSVVKLVERGGWRWEVNFGEGKTKSGVTALALLWQNVGFAVHY
jgi:hypothetical protein